jgi:hypothetical protein
VEQARGFEGEARFEDIGSATGRALWGGDIGINKEDWATLSPKTQRFVLSHETAHHTIEDFVLKNNQLWDEAEDVLTYVKMSDGRRMYAGGHTQLGESIADSVATYLQNDKFGGIDTAHMKKINEWSNKTIKAAGYSKQKLIDDVLKMQKELNAQL